MLRKLLSASLSNGQQLRSCQGHRFVNLGRPMRKRDDTILEEDTLLDLNTYQHASDETLEKLSENLESILEHRYDQGADVRLESGVLTIVVDPENTYVINKQTPNRQLWLSSPLSGPKRFDLDKESNCWTERTSKEELRRLLSEELSSLIKRKAEC